MTFEIEVHGRTRLVSVSHIDGGPAAQSRMRVSMSDGSGSVSEHYDVDARETEAGLSLIYAAGGRSVDAVVSRRSGGGYVVDLPRATLTATIDARRRRTASPEGGTSAEQRMVAPLPGRIVKVLVSPGDLVQARQDIVVIEAMKMENALQSSHEGRVHEVHVVDGASVEAGRLLVVILGQDANL